MKRRNVIRNVAAGSLFVAGVGSASAVNTESGSTIYKLEKQGDTFEVVDTFEGDVGVEHHCDHDDPGCCAEKCCNCDSGCGVCYCHEYCDEPIKA
ncbi:hypothetical protein [Halorussus litoreus]|uniref:hypothetical protein n=1 Tax=Halorussus litoreus TaxID=1710536 RepID=UPI000E23598A|nr:hypothetical protein [Halorussus litoreus]